MAKETSKANNKVGPDRRNTGQINTSKAGIRSASKQSATCSVQATVLTDEQIAERAKAIWQDRGCVPGLDEQNWHEAEAQLKRELEVH